MGCLRFLVLLGLTSVLVLADFINLDIAGNDLPGSPLYFSSSLSSNCRTACENNNKCAGYVYDTCGTACWLKNLVRETSPNSCRSFGVIVDRDTGRIDMPGGDMGGMPITTVSHSRGDCRDACERTAGCVAYSYDICSTNNCWLKSSLNYDGIEDNNCRYTGQFLPYTFTGSSTVRQGQNVNANDLRHVNVGSAHICDQTCVSEIQCRAWTWATDSHECYLKTAFSYFENWAPGISGIKACNAAFDCSGHGSCSPSGSSFTCSCSTGWTGTNCNQCASGYYGTNCQACNAASNCNNHGTCIASGAGSACSCSTGWTGSNCNQCATGWTGANCNQCAAGYYGTNCQPCNAASNCNNHGTCVASGAGSACSCSTGWTGATCNACAAGFYGTNCQSCNAATDCSSHGTCVANGAGASCSCATGWTGTKCDQCAAGYYGSTCQPCNAATSCNNHGTCVASGAGSACSCSTGWTGATCNTCAAGYYGTTCQACNAATACSGHGTCVANGAGASCSCATGWTGANCNQCASGYYGSTCQPCNAATDCSGHGTCTSSGTGFACSCSAGYYGSTCQPCNAATDCHGQGNCISSGAGAACNCSTAWSGSAQCDQCGTNYYGPSCEYFPCSSDTQYSSNIVGNDYQNLPTATAQQCDLQCCADVTCNAWTWTTDAQVCYLKNGFSSYQNLTVGISGRKQRPIIPPGQPNPLCGTFSVGTPVLYFAWATWANGSFSLGDVTGGAKPYTFQYYMVQSPQITGTAPYLPFAQPRFFASLMPGSYMGFALDANGCSITVPFSIYTIPPAPDTNYTDYTTGTTISAVHNIPNPLIYSFFTKMIVDSGAYGGVVLGLRSPLSVAMRLAIDPNPANSSTVLLSLQSGPRFAPIPIPIDTELNIGLVVQGAAPYYVAVYVNGVRMGYDTVNFYVYSSPITFFLGGDSGAEFVHGRLWQAQLWLHALNADEMGYLATQL